MLVRCPDCRRISEVPPGAAQRCECGAMLAVPDGTQERRCPRCGAEIPLYVENCLRCGTAAWAPVGGRKLGSAMARAKIITTAFFLLLAAAAAFGIWKLIPKGGAKPATAPGPAAQVSPGKRPPAKKGPERPAASAARPSLRPGAKKPEDKVDVIKRRFGDAVRLVETGDPVKREIGLRLMRGLATPALPFMRKELETAGPEVRRAIAAAMGPIGNVSTIEDLAVLMDDPSPMVRETAWKSMACFGRKAASRMKRCTESASEWVRAGAVRAMEKAELSGLARLALGKASDPSPEVRFAVAEAFGGKLWYVGATGELVRLLEDPDADVAWASRVSLGGRAAKIGERLASSLTGLGERGALLCGMALSSAGTRAGMDKLARRLGGGEELLLAETDAIREGILLRMMSEETEDASLVGALACLCAEPGARVRRKAARLLGELRSEKIYSPMVWLLASTDAVLALSCARTLAGSQGGAEELRVASTSRYRQKQVLAWAVLATRKEDFRMEGLLDAFAEEDLDPRVKGFLAASLASAPGREVKEALSKTASDESSHPVARIYAAMACCKLGLEGGHFEFLLRELKTSHLKGVEVEQVVRNQLAAANALGELGDERAVEPLVEVLNSSEMLVKAACIEALGRVGGKRATGVVLGFLVGQQPIVAEAVLTALAEMGKEAVLPLRRLLRSPDPRARLGALEAIAEIGAKEFLPDLLALARTRSVPRQVRMKAARVATLLSGERVIAAGETATTTGAPAPRPRPRSKPIVPDRPLGHLSKELRECKSLVESHEYEEALEALRALIPRARNELEKSKLKELEAAYEAGIMLKELVLERAADRHPRIYIDFAGRPTTGVLLSVDEEGIVVRITGGEIPFPWKQLSPYRFAGIANKFASEDSFEELWGLADYCEMVGRDEMAREARAKAIKLKKE